MGRVYLFRGLGEGAAGTCWVLWKEYGPGLSPNLMPFGAVIEYQALLGRHRIPGQVPSPFSNNILVKAVANFIMRPL